jgi:hypothetical protein
MPITINGSGTVTGISAGGLPDAIIQQADLAANVAGNGPAFSAYQSSAQSVTSTTFTKVLFQTEDFDTNNNFASSTFTPTVAGYYQISAAVLPSTTTSQTLVSIYKNGTAFKGVTLNGTNSSSIVSSLVYFNGSTDYVEIYTYIVGVTPALTAQAQYTWFNGAMVRGA